MQTFILAPGSGRCPETFTVTLAGYEGSWGTLLNKAHTIASTEGIPCRWEKDAGIDSEGKTVRISLYYRLTAFSTVPVPCWLLLIFQVGGGLTAWHWLPSSPCDARGTYTCSGYGISCVVS